MTRTSKKTIFDDLIGERLIIFIKHTMVLSDFSSKHEKITSNALSGYLLDVNDKYIFMGKDMEGYTTIIAIDEIGVIQIDDEEEEVMINLPDGTVMQ